MPGSIARSPADEGGDGRGRRDEDAGVEVARETGETVLTSSRASLRDRALLRRFGDRPTIEEPGLDGCGVPRRRLHGFLREPVDLGARACVEPLDRPRERQRRSPLGVGLQHAYERSQQRSDREPFRRRRQGHLQGHHGIPGDPAVRRTGPPPEDDHDAARPRVGAAPTDPHPRQARRAPTPRRRQSASFDGQRPQRPRGRRRRRAPRWPRT